MVRLGWSHGDQEIFSLEEMITLFDLQHVSRGVSSFNYDKLYWLNQHYLKTEPVEKVAQILAEHFNDAGLDLNQGPSLTDLVLIQAERCNNLVELCRMSQHFYLEDIEYDADAVKKHLRPVIMQPLTQLYERLKILKDWKKEGITKQINEVSAEFEINMAKIAQPLRVAVTGSSMSPSIDDTLFLLGQQKTLSRLRKALEQIQLRIDTNSNE